ncbi:MAG: hypothetical protein Q8R47_06025 [Nanoarchaeota archaeon]|nr:hypothetical protein [Nanoarchaeota archaeon]
MSLIEKISSSKTVSIALVLGSLGCSQLVSPPAPQAPIEPVLPSQVEAQKAHSVNGKLLKKGLKKEHSRELNFLWKIEA